jgi:hypothetical protein
LDEIERQLAAKSLDADQSSTPRKQAPTASDRQRFVHELDQSQTLKAATYQGSRKVASR